MTLPPLVTDEEYPIFESGVELGRKSVMAAPGGSLLNVVVCRNLVLRVGVLVDGVVGDVTVTENGVVGLGGDVAVTLYDAGRPDAD